MVLLVLATAAPAAWAGSTTKVFPLSTAKPMPAGLEGTPEKLTKAVAAMVGADISESSITAAAMALGCTIDDSTCLDKLARANRVSEIVFGTIRVGDDLRVFVKLTRHIASTERRERTFVLTSESPSALAKALTRSAREMFELGEEAPVPEARASITQGGKPERGERSEDPAARPAKPDERTERGDRSERTERGDRSERIERGAKSERLGKRGKRGKRGGRARPEGGRRDDEVAIGEGDDSLPGLGGTGEPGDSDDRPRGQVTTGTYALIGGGAVGVVVGTGVLIAGYSLRDDVLNAPRETRDDFLRLTELERAGKLRMQVGSALLVAGMVAAGAGVVRAVMQRRPISPSSPAPDDGGLSLVPTERGAALVFSGRFR